MMNGRPHGHQGLINRLQRDFYNLRADACPRPQMKALSIVSAPWLENAANPASALAQCCTATGMHACHKLPAWASLTASKSVVFRARVANR